MGLLRIYCSADDEKLLKGLYSTEADPLQELRSGDRLTIEFVLMQRNSTNFYEEPWKRVTSASYSLRIGLFLNSTRAELTYQNDFPAQDEFTRAGTLLMDTAQVLAAVNADPFEAACTLEIEITDALGNDRTVYRESLTLKKFLISSASVSAAPGEVAATQAWVKGIAMPRHGGNPENPCDHYFIKTRPGGRLVMVTFKDDGTPEYTLQ